MCRLSAFFGLPICAADLVTRPSRSIITQSFDARERMTGDASTPGYLNGDGFGLGWYSAHPQDVTPCVYRQARPAWNDPNLGSIAAKVYTPVLFAHVRAASPGLDVSESTCHPFRFGRYLWMHNGNLGNFQDARRHLLQSFGDRAFDFALTHGSSDTALCFAVFINLLDDPMAASHPQELRHLLERTLQILRDALVAVNADETSLLNFVVSDGQSLVATRYVINLSNPDAPAASLYYASGSSYQPDGTAPGSYAMIHTDRRPSLAIVSSEPLTEQRADWVSVPNNCAVVITKSMHILVAPIAHGNHNSISNIIANLPFSAPPLIPNLNCLTDRTLASLVSSTEGALFLEQTRNKTIAVHARTPESGSVRRRNEVLRNLTSPVHPQTGAQSLSVGSSVQSTIVVKHHTVLCCAVMGSLLLYGLEDGTIHVWDMAENMAKPPLLAAKSAVLALHADEERSLLITASSASVISIFCRNADHSFSRRAVISCEGKGDVLSLSAIGSDLYAGFSDTRVRCMPRLLDAFAEENDASDEGDNKSDTSFTGGKTDIDECGLQFPEVPGSDSHFGHVFAMTSLLAGRYLCTGCGDGLLRIWDVEKKTCVQSRDDHSGAVLVLASHEMQQGAILFSGSRDHSVKVWVWDGDSGFICKRTLRKHKDDIVFLEVYDGKLVSGSADGTICVWCATSLALLAHYRDKCLKAGAASVRHGLLFTASGEGAIHIRDFVSMQKSSSKRITNVSPRELNGVVLETLDLAAVQKFDGSDGPMISEVDDDSDDIDTLIPGVKNEEILAPPLSPLFQINGSLSNSVTGIHCHMAKHNMREKPIHVENGVSPQVLERRFMKEVLSRFMSFATVSGSEEHRESCWQGARYLGSFLESLGASVKFVLANNDEGGQYSTGVRINESRAISNKSASNSSGCNPVILARFASSKPNAKTIVCYGHYDVMPVDKTHWNTDPWSLTAVDGYLYGRGSTDNKGPIIAMAFAIKKLLDESKDGLAANVVLVFQGEGEMANFGFKQCIRSHMRWFENTSLILTSNSTWLGEETPCITYGFRGLIEMLISVTGGERNLHSGVDGGATIEPMNDLISILGTMVDGSGVICIPGFHDDVMPVSESDEELIRGVQFDIEAYRRRTGVERFTAPTSSELLKARWRKPAVSVTSIDSSNLSGFFTVVPRQASAKLSVRFVPNQKPEKLVRLITTHLEYELRKRRSPNTLKVDCVNQGDWWLGDPSCEHFQTAARAVREVWNVDAQYVCEGGSMPLFSFLAKTLNAPLVQIPLGQSSDGAHLPNERIRELNLFRGKEVVQKIIAHYAGGS